MKSIVTAQPGYRVLDRNMVDGLDRAQFEHRAFPIIAWLIDTTMANSDDRQTVTPITTNGLCPHGVIIHPDGRVRTSDDEISWSCVDAFIDDMASGKWRL